jgi:3-deoxy-7-phosphoheptulonate synthase
MYKLPLPATVISKSPLSLSAAAKIQSHRHSIQSMLNKQGESLAVIAGPCSVHNTQATLEYAKKLYHLAKQLAPTLFIVMRVYLEKPRSVTGWKGYLCDPYLDNSFKTLEGISKSRDLLLEIAEMGLPVATEFLDPLLMEYYQDTVSWGFIGARTCTSMIHRQIASRLSMPVGFKNPTNGHVNDAIQSILSSSQSHHYITLNQNSELVYQLSPGNPNCHLVLRGSDFGTNFSAHKVFDTWRKQQDLGIEKRILIDCSHGNSGKDFKNQPTVFAQILEDFIAHKTPLLGMMLESYIQEGRQIVTGCGAIPHPHISITDSCIGWEKTEKLLVSAFDTITSLAVL